MPERRRRSASQRPNKPKRSEGHLVRLQKVMALAGVASRRACEDLIEEGAVTVNGEVVRTLPVMVDPAVDRIEVEGAPLSRRKASGEERPVYVLLNKPRRTVSTMRDPEGRRTVHDLVEHPSRARLCPVGRLDYDAMGLVLMTNDGELANRLTHPRYGVEKTYRAVVRGRVEEEHLERLRRAAALTDQKKGRTVGGSRTGDSVIRIVRREATRTVVDITLQEGRNRQVRGMLADFGFPVKKLVRIAMGPLSLKGVALGHWRELTSGEVTALRRATAAAARQSAKAVRKSNPAKGRRA